MDNSHARDEYPEESAAFYFMGYLFQCIKSRGRATAEDWNAALASAKEIEKGRPLTDADRRVIGAGIGPNPKTFPLQS